MKSFRLINIRITLAALIAFALVISAFAHRSGVALDGDTNATSSYAGIDLEAYRLPDGSLPSFCLTGDAQGGSGFKPDNCDFCTLAHGVGVPADTSVVLHDRALPCILPIVWTRIFADEVLIAGKPSTGPPSYS